MVMIYKGKGDSALPGNYRGIAIMRTVAKLFFRLTLNRIEPALDSHLRPEQNGFRKARNTTQHILALRRLIEEVEASPEANLVLIFIDFVKAFDSVIWSKMWAVLRAYRIPEQMIAAIKSLYVGSGARVRSSDGLGDEFFFHAGVKQGCVLSPFLFVIVIDYIMRQALVDHKGIMVQARRSSRHPAEYVTDTGFADDIALASDQDDAHAMVADIARVASIFGLKISLTKTEVMALGCVVTIMVDGVALKNCTDFKYLGSWLRSTEKDLRYRKAQAWQALNSLKHVWSSNLPLKLKYDVFTTLVGSVLVYGSEAWTMTEVLRIEMDGTYTGMLRRVRGVTWRDHMTNEVLYDGRPRISETIRARMIAFAGHCWRSDQPVSKVMDWSAGRKGAGRPKETFLSMLCKQTNLPRDEIRAQAQDREKWRHVV
jgi:hypothetical protein